MTGGYQLDELTPSSIRASIPYFKKAIDINPGYARYTLHETFAGLWRARYRGEMLPAETFRKKRTLRREKAIELDETLGEAHNALCLWECFGMAPEFRD